MSNYLFEAVDASGLRSEGTLDVVDQSEALKRIREMGLFPTKIRQAIQRPWKPRPAVIRKPSRLPIWMTEGRVKPAVLATFTRQLATLVDVGMPLLRGLRLLHEQEENRALKRIIAEVARTIENGGTLSEALAAHPKVFNHLYVNMVRAGETGGILEVVLRRQAEFMEKALKIKGKIKAAMFYPLAVLGVATGILTLLLVYVIPKFQTVFDGLLHGKPMPAFTMAVLNVSNTFKSHFLEVGTLMLVFFAAFQIGIRTRTGRRGFDRFKLAMPVLGRLFRRIALGRFSRTLGTLLGSGVPVLQALTIVKETVGNVVVGRVVAEVHDTVKEGGTLAEPLKESGVFPAMIGGMVDVGEQTGALPDMLLKIAEDSDEQVDNSVTALTSLLEPVMIIFLALVVGSIVIAMFLPLISIIQDPGFGGGGGGDN
ncbi:MAG TPA: type II secretion system F family protein [Verrucomicrobiae bacterium]|nr:type II secretion system F family protein [Verrucomicrobiae bacterium]